MVQLYCPLQSFIINNTVYWSSVFHGGNLLGWLNPVNQVMPQGLSNCPPFLFEEHILVLWLLILVPWLILVFSFLLDGGYEATPLQMARVPLLVGWSILHQGGRLTLSFLWHGGTYPFHSPPFYLALPTMIQFGDWSYTLGVHYLPAPTGLDVVPSISCMCSFQGPWPHHLTQGLHPSSVDAPVDVHGKSCNFPLIHPREAFLVGHWVIALPLFSCDVIFLSPLVEVVLHGVGLVHLSHAWWMSIHKGKPTSDVTSRSQFQCRTPDLLFWFITT